MEIRWIPLEPDKISPKDLLEFRNRVLDIDDKPSEIEVSALQNQLNECHKDGTLYNLVAIRGNRIIAWVNGKFSPGRLTDMIRVIFFDLKELDRNDAKDLLHQLELSLPYPYYRIEIYGLGTGREQDRDLIKSAGFSEAFEISHYRRDSKSKGTNQFNKSLIFKNNIDPATAFQIYSNAFKSTWERDQLDISEFMKAFSDRDKDLSFIAYLNNKPAGMVLANSGFTSGEAYLHIIAVNDNMKGSRIGDSMIANLLSKAAAKNIHSITLCTYSDNESMRKLLERWAFVEQFRETVLYKQNVNMN